MKAIRKALQSRLESLHARVYFQTAPDNAAYPYLVYDITSVFSDGEGHETAAIDVDGWDFNDTRNTTVIEDLMTTVNTGLNKYSTSNEDISVFVTLENKIPLTDPDKRIHRRKYTYEVKIFKLKE